MWSHIGLCLLVSFAFASNNPAWKDNSEYVYNIRGRTLASLHEVANQYSGIIYKAQLRIQPKSDGSLQGQISNAQYTQVHSHLSDGWNTHIPDSEVSYKPLSLAGRPFKIEMDGGIITDIIVDQATPNWEANMIKSVVSQFQLNTNGESNIIPSKLNALPEEDQNSGVYKTMEETVTGRTETTYDIHPMPEYVLQSRPWMARHLDLKGNGEVIEVVKHKNYSNYEELPMYHYGFGEMDYDPATNQMGRFFIREAISRAILTGNLNRYTIQNTYTVNEIVMSPALNNKQKGSVTSIVNATLQEIKSKGQQIGEVSNPVPLGNLVYTYENHKSASVSEKKLRRREYDSADRYQRSSTMNRIRRSIGDYDDGKNSDSDSSSSEENKRYRQDQPELRQAPHAPLLPLDAGYRGMSIKHDPNVDIKKTVREIAQDMGKDWQNPEDFLVKHTLDKFTTMTALIRLMNQDELKQVAMELYSQNLDGPQRDTWTSFRDAVAESGSGPALLTIQEWIQSDKIKDEEAAEVITAMASSVREPTEEYMKSFFEFIKNSKVQSQKNLRDSALLAYSDLVKKVCSDREESRREYPVEVFGKFCTEEQRQQIKDSVIPYFTQQLHEAVSGADTRRIHTYIRALGNFGDKQILGAFEPYLEGKKQASQFQRLLMVMAMDKLTQTNPKVARSVLYKIYQNSGESQEVRVAAVYQLMRTSPPTAMLQRMASYTNMDNQEHVNGAVKSSIESAAHLRGEEYRWIRSSAEAARPLLNKREYGTQHSQNYLRGYIYDELNLQYKHTAQFFGNEEGFFPKGLRYSINNDLGGAKGQLANLQAIVSSVDELFHVFDYQRSSYQEQQQKQQQNAQEQQQHPFSSLNVAKLLNMKADEREQFEFNAYTQLHGAFQRIWAYDNQSVEQLPEEIQKREEELKNGKSYHYTKVTNNQQMILSFPTESGLPFLFTYESPMVIKVEGRVSGQASPQISSGGKLHRPDTITLKTELGFTAHAKIQSRLSFITPFDSQRYMAGFDKNVQVHIPLYGNFKVDVKNGQIEAEIENKEYHQGARLFHYSTWPYTSKGDIKDFKPVPSQQNTHYIKKSNLRGYEGVVGKEQTGIALRIQVEHEREFINIPRLSKLVEHRDITTGLLKLWDDASIQYGQVNIQLQPGQSPSRKCIIRAGSQYKYQQGKRGNQDQSPDWSRLSRTSDPRAKRDSLIDTIGAGINNAQAFVLDASIEFQGGKGIKYSVLGGVGKSNVDPKSRVMIHYQKNSDDKPYEASLEAKSYIPNTNGLDLSESLKTEPKADSTIEVQFGESLKSASKAELKVEWRRSEERKQYLQKQQMYKECQREMKEGNYQLPACANMTMAANLLDRINVDVKYENVNQEVMEMVRTVYDAVKLNYYPTLEVDRTKGTGQQNELKFQARFDPDLRSVNMSVQVKDHQATINTIPVQQWAQEVFVVHPVFHLRSRIAGAAFGLRTYRPICVVDQTQASTFNNRTYPAPLDRKWTLLLHYVPKDARHTEQQISVEEQLRRQPQQYTVLARQSSESAQQKDVKITVSSPETEYKVIDITLTPSGQQGSNDAKAKVTVDGKQAQFSDEQSYDVKDGYIQIYSLPNGEVKVEVEDAFYVIYDGQRVKLTAFNGKFRDSNRGLCGTFNDDRADDFLTSENCVARDPEEFIKSYEVEGSEGQQQRQQFAGKSNQCVDKESPLYTNVISDRDAGRREKSGGSGRAPKGTRFQTRYVEQDGEICFTIRPVPVCNDRSHQRGSISKSVPVHCVQKSNVSQLWKSQIDKGASPDFGHKQESKTVQIEVPRSCSS